jgi:glycosyltransferase involved in cell wall biosynthesis
MTNSTPEEDTKRVRVLINGLHAKSGGGITYLQNVLPYLADDPRLQLHLLISTDQLPVYPPVDERIRIHAIDLKQGLGRLLAWEQVSVPIIARVMNADVTFCPSNYGPLFAPNLVIMLRNGLAVAGSERRIHKLLYWFSLGLMTAVCLLACRRAIAVSEYARRALTFNLPQRISRKAAVIHHGVDRDFAPSEAPAETPDRHATQRPFLFAVADIYIQKNLHTLIAALAGIRDKFPDVVLKIAGRRIDEAYYDRLQREIRRRNLESCVVFLGSLGKDELVRHYRTCDAFVFPSTVETFGNPLAEAMAAGAPIACSNVTAMPEIVGDAGVYFDPRDVGQMYSAILRILEEPGLADTLSERGRRRAEMFSWEKTARCTGDILVSAAGISLPAAE